MAWFDREFIAVPEEAKNQLVYKWPDLNIRRYSRALVNADQMALFVKSGHVIATMGPGRHRIDADELPLLGSLVDALSAGRYYRAELYFLLNRDISGLKFGGRLADIVDPVSEQVVTLRVFGEFALAVRDPARLVTDTTGTADLADPTQLHSWCADMLLKAMKVAVTRGIAEGTWPILGLSAQLAEVETAVLQQVNTSLYQYGLRISRLGNFDITLAPEDAERLKRLAKDVTYIRMVGDFRQYAAGEMALGAGQGMAHGGAGGGDGGILGAALGLGALGPAGAAAMPQLAGSQQAAATGPTPGVLRMPPITRPTATTEDSQACGSCGKSNSLQARFCIHCGEKLTPAEPAPIQHCAACGEPLAEGAKFCAHCGERVGAA